MTALRAFFHPDQAAHAPLQSMRRGRVVPARDLPERTGRLLAALAACGVAATAPPDAGDAPMRQVHTADYLHFLATAWEQWQHLPETGPETGPEVWPGYFPYWSGSPDQPARPPCPAEHILGRAGWYLGDLSAPVGPGTWLAVQRSCDTAVAGAAALLAGDRAAYALCRPSGHHARTDRAAGLCYVNNAAVAAACLRGRFGRVAVLDVDVHHGDGTEQVFYGRPDVLTVSVHADPRGAYPFFTGYADAAGHGDGTGCNLNLPLPHGTGWDGMAAALDRALDRIGRFGADALVLAAGFDTCRHDPVGLMTLEVEDYRRLAARVRSAGLPTLIVQEGGYATDAIGDCLAALISGFQ